MDTLSSPSQILSFFGEDPLLSASLRVTSRCNYRCRHCYADGRPGQPELTSQEIRTVIDQLWDLGVMRIFFTGGEPFLLPDLPDLIAHGKRKGCEIAVSTNGSLITDGLLRHLAEVHLDHFQVSIDGKEETHEKVRGISGSFVRACDAVMDAVRLLPDTNITVAMVLAQENLQEAESVFALADQLGAKTFVPIPLTVTGRARADQAPPPVELSQIFLQLAEARPKFRVELSLAVPPAIVPPVMRQTRFGKGYLCTFPYLLGINANGDVAPCDMLLNEPDYILGNVRDMSLRDIWCDSPLLLQLRQVEPADIWGVCTSCSFKELCCGGCRAAALLTYKDIAAPDPWCQSFFDKNLLI